MVRVSGDNRENNKYSEDTVEIMKLKRDRKYLRDLIEMQKRCYENLTEIPRLLDEILETQRQMNKKYEVTIEEGIEITRKMMKYGDSVAEIRDKIETLIERHSYMVRIPANAWNVVKITAGTV